MEDKMDFRSFYFYQNQLLFFKRGGSEVKKLLIFISILGFSINAFGQAKNRPNVVVIMFDDMGYGDIEPYGMTGIPTPNFNKLAKEGTRFTHFNAAQPICSPSRAALLTGCYPNRLGISGAILPNSTMALDLKEETIASILKHEGYKTGMFGKWHLGNRAPNWPIHYGFDQFYGIPYSHDIWPRDNQGKLITDPKNAKSTWPELLLLNGDKAVDTIKTTEQLKTLTQTFTSKAVSFINENKEKPFFLYLAQPMPHVPLAASAKFAGKSEMGTFGDVIMELDWSIGEIAKALKAAKIDQNTILIVTSDNGPWLIYGNHAGSNGGFKEGKMNSSEGGTRVPLLVKWPGKIEAGGTNSQLMTNMDLLPTIAAATGAKLPKNKIDGLNFLPSILNPLTIKGPREVFYYYYGKNSLEAIRYKNWKLILPHIGNTYIGLHGKDGAANKSEKVNFPQALFDLAHDPGERYDVLSQYPEIVAKILALAEEARTDLGDDITNRTGKNIRYKKTSADNLKEN
jgi:arylsulfatase A-like enzyme